LVEAVVREPHEAPRADNPEATRDRACGCLLGLAIAEALLTEDGNQGAQQQRGRIRRHVRGSATALAVALVVSLIERGRLDECDLAARFADHYATGEYACSGVGEDAGDGRSRGAGIGRTTDEGEFVRRGERLPSVLTRIAPLAIRYWQDPTSLRAAAGRMARAMDEPADDQAATLMLVQTLAGSIAGLPRGTVLTRAMHAIAMPPQTQLPDPPSGRDQCTRGHSDVLTRALHCLDPSHSFEGAIARASVMLPHRAEVMLVTGQLAGAIYGLSGIPAQWLDSLAWRDPLENLALELTTPAGWYPG
jgi:ADP-ribosyl-[dinitrogen reductase] hydrolase